MSEQTLVGGDTDPGSFNLTALGLTALLAALLAFGAGTATTEPAPARSVYRLDMSDSTPTLMTVSETCACTPGAASTASRCCLGSRP